MKAGSTSVISPCCSQIQSECVIAHGKKKGWLKGKNKNHLCGTSQELLDLFGLFWLRADVIDNSLTTPGHWKYIGNHGTLPPPNGNPDPNNGIGCFTGANQQNDFFQILNFALNQTDCAAEGTIDRTFAIGASMIDQYDSADGCFDSGNHPFQPDGCDLDYWVVGDKGKHWNQQGFATHTTAIEYGKNGHGQTVYGMELNDCLAGATGGCKDSPHRPTPAPTPGVNTQVINHFFSNVGELGYAVDTSTAGMPTLNFSSPNFPDAPVLDFFSYNPVSSAYPRAGIVNLYTKNEPVLAAILARTLKTDAAANPSPSPVIAPSPGYRTDAASTRNRPRNAGGARGSAAFRMACNANRYDAGYRRASCHEGD